MVVSRLRRHHVEETRVIEHRRCEVGGRPRDRRRGRRVDEVRDDPVVIAIAIGIGTVIVKVVVNAAQETVIADTPVRLLVPVIIQAVGQDATEIAKSPRPRGRLAAARPTTSRAPLCSPR